MSESKFVVGQWVTCYGRLFRVKQITEQWMHSDEGYSTTWDNVEPFFWQVGRTYRTTLDGVTATINRNDKDVMECLVSGGRWNGSGAAWEKATGIALPNSQRPGLYDDFPDLLPYLADEPQAVADAATYSEFAEADECDDVNHPTHYTQHPSGVECVAIAEHFTFNIGNAIKYLWRAGLKGDALEDLRKAAWYVQREIERAKR